jgi:hypothetical protein
VRCCTAPMPAPMPAFRPAVAAPETRTGSGHWPRDTTLASTLLWPDEALLDRTGSSNRQGSP